MKEGKLLFIDMDGVLNSQDNMNAMTVLHRVTCENEHLPYDTRDAKTHPCDSFNMHRYDERCVRWLEYIIKTTGCDLVISSTWRYMGLKKFREMWQS